MDTCGRMAAIGTDYLEKTWQQNYRGRERTYDYEGVVAEGYPLLQKIPDVNRAGERISLGQPGAARKDALPLRRVHLASTFCDVKMSGSSQEGPMLER